MSLDHSPIFIFLGFPVIFLFIAHLLHNIARISSPLHLSDMAEDLPDNCNILLFLGSRHLFLTFSGLFPAVFSLLLSGLSKDSTDNAERRKVSASLMRLLLKVRGSRPPEPPWVAAPNPARAPPFEPAGGPAVRRPLAAPHLISQV